MRSQRGRLLALGLILLVPTACRQKMADQPKYKPLAAGAFFADGRASRPLVAGTVARGHLDADPIFYTGKSGEQLVSALPLPLSRALLVRGAERFNIFCAPCHDRVGSGHGMVVRRGYARPPSFHIDRLRNAPIGHFFDVMTHGFGAMPSYAVQVPAADRWAIAAYIRALQLSQNARLADVPPDVRGRLQAAE